jgi:hypothetical protein
MIWLKWIFSPIGRWLSAAAGAVMFLFALYLKGRRDGKEVIRKEQEYERNRRSRDVIQADDRVRRDIASGRVLENDGHRRD